MVFVQNHALKAFKTEQAVLVSIVGVHDSLHLGHRDILPEFRKGLVELRSRNVSRAVNVELLEETSKHRLVVDQFGVDGCGEELGIAHVVRFVHV